MKTFPFESLFLKQMKVYKKLSSLCLNVRKPPGQCVHLTPVHPS